jgi:hypothetical protein
LDLKIAAQLCRRKATRISANLEVVIHLIDHRANSKGKYPLVAGVIRNLSVSGAYIDLPLLLWEDTKVRLQFSANGQDYDRYGVVCRHGFGDHAEVSNGHGIRFMPRALATVRPPAIPIFGRRLSASDSTEGHPLPSFQRRSQFGSSVHISGK